MAAYHVPDEPLGHGVCQVSTLQAWCLVHRRIESAHEPCEAAKRMVRIYPANQYWARVEMERRVTKTQRVMRRERRGAYALRVVS